MGPVSRRLSSVRTRARKPPKLSVACLRRSCSHRPKARWKRASSVAVDPPGKVRLRPNAVRKFTWMRRRLSRGTPSRFASRRSASRKTVASTRSPVDAAAVIPARHIPRTEERRRRPRHRSCRSQQTAAAPRFATVFETRDGSPHGSLRKTASRAPEVRRHAAPPSRACGRRAVGLRVRGRQTAPAPGSGPGTPPPIRP